MYTNYMLNCYNFDTLWLNIFKKYNNKCSCYNSRYKDMPIENIDKSHLLLVSSTRKTHRQPDLVKNRMTTLKVKP